ncbi:hypothetical protein [Novosphingobium soli]|uniref:DUF4105 domain-containing protein n=1 Tax=Novosphingobium soli TaxID=574956 RepID=A0ABV6CPH9_9SPHN
MTITVFTWNMGGVGPQGTRGVGHASAQVGDAYISWWPAEHALKAALDSRAKRHTIRDDIEADGTPHFASAPIADLDEDKVLSWWKSVCDANDNWSHDERALGSYRFLSNNCSTTVFRALLIGAAPELRTRIWATYLSSQANTEATLARAGVILDRIVGGWGGYAQVIESIKLLGIDRTVTALRPAGLIVTPLDVHAVVSKIWS